MADLTNLLNGDIPIQEALCENLPGWTGLFNTDSAELRAILDNTEAVLCDESAPEDVLAAMAEVLGLENLLQQVRC